MDLNTMLRGLVREELAIALAEQQQPAEQETYMSTKEVAALTGLSISYFEVGRSLNSPGHPPYHRIGRRVVYKRSDVVRWLEARKRGGAA